MLNISFLTCTKVELFDLIVCFAVNGEKFQSLAMTLTLAYQCPLSNFQGIFLSYNVFQFHVPRSITFESSCKNTEIQKYRNTNMETNRLWRVLLFYRL